MQEALESVRGSAWTSTLPVHRVCHRTLPWCAADGWWVAVRACERTDRLVHRAGEMMSTECIGCLLCLLTDLEKRNEPAPCHLASVCPLLNAISSGSGSFLQSLQFLGRRSHTLSCLLAEAEAIADHSS